MDNLGLIRYTINMRYTVIETNRFLKSASSIWSDEEREEFIDWIAENPEAGDVMVGGAPLRKVRWSRRGTGKSGGARVIYFNRLANGWIMLLKAYPKSVNDTLTDAEINELKKALEIKP
jgi:hypothetical protein